MADLDTPLITTGALGHSITTSLRALIAGATAAVVQTALGLGTAAVTAASSYATAAQGAKADTALQPAVAGAGIHAGGFAKHKLVAGAAAGNVTVAGIKVGDELNEVVYFVGAGTAVTTVSDLTAEFSITGADTINNGSATSSTGGVLLVRWTKLTT
jgi:hypothetical protein